MVAVSQPALASQILTDLLTMAISQEVKQIKAEKQLQKNNYIKTTTEKQPQKNNYRKTNTEEQIQKTDHLCQPLINALTKAGTNKSCISPTPKGFETWKFYARRGLEF